MLKIGVQSAGWYNRETPLESFEYIKSCGFESVDFNIDHYLSPKKLKEEGIYPTVFDGSIEEVLEFFTPLKEASEKTGVIIGQMHAPFPVWYEGLNEVNEHIKMALDKCFAVCEYVGCPAIVVHPVDGKTREEEWERNLALYRGLIPIIKKYKGVKICLENIFGRKPSRDIIEGRLSNAEDPKRMIDILNAEAGGDYFGFCLDVGHANLTRRNLKEFIKTLGPRLTILHIHDNDGRDDLHIVPYSCLHDTKNHVCDWNGFVEGLKEIGYSGVLAFETFRIFSAYPKAVHTEVLKLISAIGHYWAEEIEK
ncbi:MAG: sugar phosphate isomerase/epimerase [Ruminococcaceae bacterium]|nr:sugar phosphate isomerase/epimerase [Oscillospiraceae bacterium]